jgi:hypothetical protein
VTHIQRKRRVGLGAAWLAAYALVLNVILSSALLATLSPSAFANGHPLCTSSSDVGIAGDDSSPAKPSGVHCPMCIGNHVAGVPPVLPTLLDRAPTQAQRVVGFLPQRHALAPGRDHRPRGPPHLV